MASIYGPSFALSPDGSHLVYVSAAEGGLHLRLRERDQLRSRPVPGTDGAWQPFFSPDGQRVAFITGGRDLKVVSLTGEPPLQLADSGLSRSGGSWGTDGFLYFGWRQHRGGLSRMPATGAGAPEGVTTVDTAQGENFHGWPDALPSGRGVLFTAARASNQASEEDDVAVVDLATGKHRALVQGVLGRYAPGYLVFVRFDGSLLAAPFDQDKLVLTGPPIPLLAGMPVRPGPDLALSQSGRLVYSSGIETSVMEVVWVDREGRATALEPGWTVPPNFSGGPVLSPDETQVALSVVGSEGAHIWIFHNNQDSPDVHPHLTIGQARRVARALQRWIKDEGGKP